MKNGAASIAERRWVAQVFDLESCVGINARFVLISSQVKS